MRFLHTGDLHIGASKHVVLKYLKRQESMLDQLIDHAREQKVDAVLMAGDIFDSADVTHEERSLFTRKLLTLDSFVPVLCIPGNHDEVSPGLTTLHPYALMTRAGRFRQSYVVEQTTLVQIQDTLFVLLVSKGADFKRHLRATLKSLRRSSLEIEYNHLVVVVHQTVKGGLADNGHTLPDGVDWKDSVPSDVPVTYFALGDLHTHQKVGRCAFYSGSPVMTKFDPVVAPHGVLLVDTNDPKHPTMLPIESQQFLIVNASDEKALRKAETDGHLVKARLSKNADEKELARVRNSKAVVKTDYAKVDVDLGELRVGTSLDKDVSRAMKRRGLNKADRALGLELLRQHRPVSHDLAE